MRAFRSRQGFFLLTSMKRLRLPSSLVAATLFLALGLRGEDVKPKPTPPAGGMRAQRQAELLKRFDKNGDGKLDDDERAEAKDAMMKEQLDKQAAREKTEKEKAATNASAAGASTTPAVAATTKPPAPPTNPPGPGMRAELLRRLDRNGDGKVDEVELADGITYIAANLDQFPGIKQRFDRNADGRLDDQERVALDDGLHQLVKGGAGMAAGRGGPLPPIDSLPPPVREQLVKRFDKDGDGKLNDTELAAAQAEMARRREERMARGGFERGPGPAMAPDKPAVVDKEDEANVAKMMEKFAPKYDSGKKPDPKK